MGISEKKAETISNITIMIGCAMALVYILSDILFSFIGMAK